MSKGFFEVPIAVNEPVRNYAPGSKERASVLSTYQAMKSQHTDISMCIDGKAVSTNNKGKMVMPHDHKHVLGTYSLAEKSHVEEAIASALKARQTWAHAPWEQRAAIFLKAAELIEGPFRDRINAATMLQQSKTIHQAEIDASCELIDFLRFNVQFMTEIYSGQPESSSAVWNRVEYRPLEGFVYAVTPFNFTSIAANLAACVAMMGNVVVWKPSDHQIYSAKIIMDIFEAAGVPAGVINVVFGDPKMITDTVLESEDFAGLHFTGSTEIFKSLWRQIGNHIDRYKSYPRIVGETGGKDFIAAHSSADPEEVSVAILRGAFEFQGQKCSAASRAYIPSSLWPKVKSHLLNDLKTLKMGTPEDFTNFMTAVIHEGSFDKLAKYIDQAKASSEAEIIFGGNYDKSVGYFVEPTVILTTNPKYDTMCTELFGPVITVYVYNDKDYEEMLNLVDSTSSYALTGAIFAKDRYAIGQATQALENCAGNFYINDKPTGAVVGQQPFGGARSSGTNDKAGSPQNLLRWVSPRLIKETFVPPKDYRYPFLG